MVFGSPTGDCVDVLQCFVCAALSEALTPLSFNTELPFLPISSESDIGEIPTNCLSSEWSLNPNSELITNVGLVASLAAKICPTHQRIYKTFISFLSHYYCQQSSIIFLHFLHFLMTFNQTPIKPFLCQHLADPFIHIFVSRSFKFS